MQNIKKFLLIIIDFDNKTLIFQIILFFSLIALFGLNLGFNEILLSWARSLLSNIIDTDDLNKFAMKYIIILALTILILVKVTFALIAILKHNHITKY